MKIKNKKPKFLKVFKSMQKALSQHMCRTKKPLREIIKKHLNLMKLLPNILNLQKSSTIIMPCQPYKYDKIVKSTKNFDFDFIVKQIIDKPVDELVFQMIILPKTLTKYSMREILN